MGHRGIFAAVVGVAALAGSGSAAADSELRVTSHGDVADLCYVAGFLDEDGVHSDIAGGPCTPQRRLRVHRGGKILLHLRRGTLDYAEIGGRTVKADRVEQGLFAISVPSKGRVRSLRFGVLHADGGDAWRTALRVHRHRAPDRKYSLRVTSHGQVGDLCLTGGQIFRPPSEGGPVIYAAGCAGPLEQLTVRRGGVLLVRLRRAALGEARIGRRVIEPVRLPDRRIYAIRIPRRGAVQQLDLTVTRGNRSEYLLVLLRAVG